MKRMLVIPIACLLALAADLAAQSNIDNSVPNKYAWSENAGWMNWRDAAGGANGAFVGDFAMSGFIWSENIGWINLGNGPAVPPTYTNTIGSDCGVNINPDGSLHGLAWAENVGWINFDGGQMASTPAPARINCAGRLSGMVWSENIGWINLSVQAAGQFVAVDATTQPYACDMNHDGKVDGRDVREFVIQIIQGGGTWRDLCSGDLSSPPNNVVDLSDVQAFTQCLLTN